MKKIIWLGVLLFWQSPWASECLFDCCFYTVKTKPKDMAMVSDRVSSRGYDLEHCKAQAEKLLGASHDFGSFLKRGQMGRQKFRLTSPIDQIKVCYRECPEDSWLCLEKELVNPQLSRWSFWD